MSLRCLFVRPIAQEQSVEKEEIEQEQEQGMPEEEEQGVAFEAEEEVMEGASAADDALVIPLPDDDADLKPNTPVSPRPVLLQPLDTIE